MPIYSYPTHTPIHAEAGNWSKRDVPSKDALLQRAIHLLQRSSDQLQCQVLAADWHRAARTVQRHGRVLRRLRQMQSGFGCPMRSRLQLEAIVHSNTQMLEQLRAQRAADAIRNAAVLTQPSTPF